MFTEEQKARMRAIKKEQSLRGARCSNCSIRGQYDACKSGDDEACAYYEGPHQLSSEEISRLTPDYSSPKRSSGGCYIATCVYGTYDCPEVWILRRFRDSSLATSWMGRQFIRLYYVLSPKIVKTFGGKVWFNKAFKPIICAVVKNLRDSGIESTPYSDV